MSNVRTGAIVGRDLRRSVVLGGRAPAVLAAIRTSVSEVRRETRQQKRVLGLVVEFVA